MALQLIRQGEVATSSLVQLHVGVPRYRKSALVGGKGVIRNRIVKEVVNFGGGHFQIDDRRGSLLPYLRTDSSFGTVDVYFAMVISTGIRQRQGIDMMTPVLLM